MKVIRFLLILWIVIDMAIAVPTPPAVAAPPPPDSALPDAQSTSGPFSSARALSAEVDRGLISAAARIISDVPAYMWYRGCGPTAAGMVIGYWDTHGFDWLVPVNAATQTAEVDAVIASPEHYDDYALPIDNGNPILPDKSELPLGDEHVSNSLADFMHTSWSIARNAYGWSWFSDVGYSLRDYINLVSPGGWTPVVSNFYGQNWPAFTTEIDANRPVIFLVDSNGDGSTDHFITAIGYDDSTGVQRYAALNTWDHSTHWYDFGPLSSGKAWGIFGMVTLRFEAIPAPAGFEKSAPQPGAAGLDDHPTLSWQPTSPVTRYEVCLKTSETAACSWTDVGLDISRPLTALDPGVTYYWQVRAYNGESLPTEANGPGAFWTFTTRPAQVPPAAFNKTSPESGSSGLPITLTLVWEPTSPVDRYEFCYDQTDDGDCALWLKPEPELTPSVSVDLIYGTTYYWQVRAYNGDAGPTYAGGGDTPYWSFTTRPAPLDAPLNLTGTSGLYDDRICLDWDPVADASYYTLERASNLDGTRSSLGQTTENHFCDTGVWPDQAFVYWVQACNLYGCSPSSAPGKGYTARLRLFLPSAMKN